MFKIVCSKLGGHNLMLKIKKGDFKGMFNDQLNERHTFDYPPYTRIIKLGNRLGDNASMAMIELVDFNTIYNNTSSSETIEESVAESTPE